MKSKGVEPTMGVPPMTVQGQSNVPFNETAMTYFPDGLDEPVFLGATRGHESIPMYCGRCQYQGPSIIKRKRGWFNVMLGIITFGVGFVLPGMDTYHLCPSCHREVAVATLA